MVSTMKRKQQERNALKELRVETKGCEWSNIFQDHCREFCQQLSSCDSKSVQEAVEDIVVLRQQIVINMLRVGERLNRLRAAIGIENFCYFMKYVLPATGISRSTGYRWLGLAERLGSLFPNPSVRQHLMALTDGRGIITRAVDDEEEKDTYKAVLTPAAQAALNNLPPAPKKNGDNTESEAWVRQFIKEMGKARYLARTAPPDASRERIAMIRRFKRFTERYGLKAGEDLCGAMDKILTQISPDPSGKANGVSVVFAPLPHRSRDLPTHDRSQR